MAYALPPIVLKRIADDPRISTIRIFESIDNRNRAYNTVRVLRKINEKWVSESEFKRQSFKRDRAWWTAFSQRGGFLRKSQYTCAQFVRGGIPLDGDEQKSELAQAVEDAEDALKRIRNLI